MKEKEKSDVEPLKKKRSKAYVMMGRCMLPANGISKKVQNVYASLRLDKDGVSTFIKNDSLMLKIGREIHLQIRP